MVWAVLFCLISLSSFEEEADTSQMLISEVEALKDLSPQKPHQMHAGSHVDQTPSLAPQQPINAEIGELDAQGPVPSPRGGHTFVRWTDGSLLLWGGCDLSLACDTTLFLFDTESESWSIIQTSGTPPTGRMGHVGWVDGTANPYMWVFGGFVGETNTHSSETHALYLANMRWSKAPIQGPSPKARYEMSVVTLNSTHALVYGGSDSSEYYGDVFIFNADKFIWTSISTSGEVPQSRESHTAIIYRPESGPKQMIVYGGYHSDNCLDDTYALNLETFAWQLLSAGGAGARGGHIAFLLNSRMFVLGGCNEPQELCHRGIVLFDPKVTKQWAQGDVADSAPPREWAAVAQTSNRRAYVFGGCLPGDKCLNDIWLFEFGETLAPLQFVSSQVSAGRQSTSGHRIPASIRTNMVQARIDLSQDTPETPATDPTTEDLSNTNTTESANTTASTETTATPPLKPAASRPGRQMMDTLKEVRDQLRVTEDICNNLPGRGGSGPSSQRAASRNSTHDPNTCPPGSVPVRLSDLNLEIFNALIKSGGNATIGSLTGTAPSPSPVAEEKKASPSPQPTSGDESADAAQEGTETPAEAATFIEISDLYEYDSDIALLEVDNTNHTVLNWTITLNNTIVCFGRTGPVAVLNSNLTVMDIWKAFGYNRTLEYSNTRGGFKPSPSPSPIPYNATNWVEAGRFMGRRVDQGKRRPLSEVAQRADRHLSALNCTDPQAYLRPECTLPFGNLTGRLNATANWTHHGGASGDGSGASDGGGSEGEAGAGDGSAGGTEGGASDSGATGEGVSGGGAACSSDDPNCASAGGAGTEGAGAGTGGSSGSQTGDTLCAPDDQACLDGMRGTGNTTVGRLGGKNSGGVMGDAAALFEEHGTLVALVGVAVIAGFIVLGAVLTNIMKEKRRLMKLESSLRDAQLKQQDEVWIKSS